MSSLDTFSTTKTHLGYMRALCSARGLTRLVWQQQPFDDSDSQESDVSRETITQLSAYLAGQLTTFTIPLDLSSRSPAAQRWLASVDLSRLPPPRPEGIGRAKKRPLTV